MKRPDFVVVDEVVAEKHELPWAVDTLAVEARKDVATWQRILDAFIERGLDREAIIAAVGGGTLTDVAGFAAATYLRGIRWRAVPTTLLAQVDAAHGGKTGIDHAVAKNLVGAFHPPQEVWSDAVFLDTLSERDLRGGMAEMIKHGIIGAPYLLDAHNLLDYVEEAARVKLTIVANDPKEHGERKVLNLGHTIGHGIEQASGYALHHGECVAIGLRGACAIAEQHCGFPRRERARVDAVLDRHGLPRTADVDPAEVLGAMRHDKKRRKRTLRWALPIAIGRVRIFSDVDAQLVRRVVHACCRPA